MRIRSSASTGVKAPAAEPTRAPKSKPKSTPKPDDFSKAPEFNRAKNPLRPEHKERMAALTYSHPTANNAELATLFASDAVLGKVRPWTEEEVTYLRDRVHVVPSEYRAGKALGEQLAKLAAAADGQTTLTDFIEQQSKRYPRLSRDQVLKLSRTDDALAKALRPMWLNERSTTLPAGGLVKLTQSQARELNLGRETLSRVLGDAKGGVVDAWMKKLNVIDDTRGLNNDTLRPRDLEHVDAMTRQVTEALFEALGRKTLKLTEVRAALPKVLGQLADRATQYGNDALLPVAQGAATDLVNVLASDWRQNVLTRRETPTAWGERQKLAFGVMEKLRGVVPEAFPDPGNRLLGAEGIEVISALYKDLTAGKMTTTAFYARAKISSGELLMLQNADPERFPRDEATPFWRTVKGRRNKEPEVVSDVAPKKGRWGDREYSLDDLAAELGKRATQLFEKNVLTTVGEVLTELNRDAKLVAKYGTLTKSRYEQSVPRKPDAFPPFKNLDVILPRLAADVKAVLEKKPGLSPSELVVEMKKQYPTFKLTRVYQLRERYPDLVPAAAGPRMTPETREKDAAELAQRLAKGGVTMEDISAAMRKTRPYATVAYLRGVQKTFLEMGSRDRARSNLGWAKTVETLIRLSPPGTGEGALLAQLNRLLEKKGLSPYPGPTLPVNLMERIEKRELINAEVTSELVAEYLRAAPKGEAFEQVQQRILKDYPTLDLQRLSTYRNLWSAKPGDYPALKGMKNLSGRGEGVEAPRFIGGWDVERALLQPAKNDQELATGLARLSQFTRLENRLPLLDMLVAQLDGKRPLAHKNVLWVTHMLGTTPAQANAMREAGLAASKTIVVGSPYGTNDVVRTALVEDGFDARVPPLDEKGYHREVEKALLEMADRARKNHEPVVVMDDGGQVTQILSSDPRFADVLSKFKVVEQTTRGITNSEANPLKVPLVSVATSKSKAVEGELVGRSVAQKVIQGLERSGKPVKGLEVTVVGYGVVGSKVVEALKAAGAKVTVVESTPTRAAEAKKAGFAVVEKAKALAKCDVVIGATGAQSLTLEDLESLKNGAAFVSASSKQVETDIHGLKAKAASSRTLDPGAPLVHLPNVEYSFKNGKQLLALGDGWPINFDGDVEDIAPDEIQITRGAMFLGVLQAASLNTHSAEKDRLVPLDPVQDEALYAAYRAYQKEHPPSRQISDPAKWADVLRQLAKDAGL